MHGLGSIHTKIKLVWAKLTRHTNMQSHPKTRLKMSLRPRKAKVCLPHGIQETDEMEDSGEESQESIEGSLLALTEATSDLGAEEPGKEGHSMEPPIKDPCRFLKELPRELRYKVCI